MTKDTTFPTIGILGGGQLGRMMAAEAVRMGVGVRLLSPKEAGPMQPYTGAQVGDWKDAGVLRDFTASCDVITVESEWAPAEHAAEVLPDGVHVWPAPATMQIIRDKGVQKTRLAEAGLPVPDFARCATISDATDAARQFGYPVVLKQYRGAYDGYGNATVHSDEELRTRWPDLAAEDGLLVEAFMDFERELAVQVARRPGGEQVVYPVAHTVQEDHRCHAVIVSEGHVRPEITKEAQRIAQAAVDVVDGVGLTAVELFEMADGRVLINELAPRPHNTGHYSIEGSHTSQFENHVRAVLDWPLGSTALRMPVAVMVNVLGTRDHSPPSTQGLKDALAVPGVNVHIYNKPDVRSFRKMGHITALGTDVDETLSRAERAAASIRL